LLGGGQLSLDADPGTDLQRDIETATVDLRAWQPEGIEVITILDENYPLNLRTCTTSR